MLVERFMYVVLRNDLSAAVQDERQEALMNQWIKLRALGRFKLCRIRKELQAAARDGAPERFVHRLVRAEVPYWDDLRQTDMTTAASLSIQLGKESGMILRSHSSRQRIKPAS